MEIGNLIFGNSRGNFPIKRGKGFERELGRLFDAYAPNRDNSWREYGVEFENDTFAVFPYYWGDCTCGYDEFESGWHEQNSHQETCYQVRLAKEVAAYDQQIGYQRPGSVGEIFDSHFDVQAEQGPFPGFVVMAMQPKRRDSCLYDLHDAFEHKVMKRLCKELNLTYPQGCAVHCTCDYQERWAAWSNENSHRADCLLIKPNFLYKPTGFEIEWYKYPLRDSYMSENLSLPEFRLIIDRCIASLSGAEPAGAEEGEGGL